MTTRTRTPEELANAFGAPCGAYYSLVREVWPPSLASFQGGLDAIRREKPHGHFHQLLATLELVKEKQSSDSISKASKLVAYAVTGPGGKKDLFGARDGEDAHQIPDSHACALSYGIIGQAIIT